MGRSIVALLASLAMLPPTATAAEPATVVLQPSSKWVLDYAEEGCRMARFFGATEDDRTILILSQLSPSDDLEWSMAGKRLDRFDLSRLEARFGPSLASFEIRNDVRSSIPDLGPSIRANSYRESQTEKDAREKKEKDGVLSRNVGLPTLPLSDSEQIEWLEVSGRSQALRLKTGNMRPVFEAMNICMEDLLVSWGVDLETLKRQAMPPDLRNLRNVTARISENYPRHAEANGQMADFSIRVMVEADGAVSKCFTRALTVAEDFGTNACAVFTRYAKFDPARDVNGDAIPSIYTTRILYRLY